MYSFHINICTTGLNIETFSHLQQKIQIFSKTKMAEAKPISSPMVADRTILLLNLSKTLGINPWLQVSAEAKNANNKIKARKLEPTLWQQPHPKYPK